MSQHGRGLRASADSRWTSVKYTPGAKYRWKSWAGSLNTELTRWYNVDHDTLIHEVSRSHTTTHHSRQDSSGRVISPSQRPLPDKTKHSLETDILAASRIRTRNPSNRAAIDPSLRRRGHGDRLLLQLEFVSSTKYYMGTRINCSLL